MINIVGYTVKICKMLFMSPISLFICDCEHRLLQKSSMYDQTYKQRMLIKQLFILLKWTTIWTSFYLLYHYPRSKCVIFDNGREFKLHFKSLCRSFGLKQKLTTVLNPQANAILERIHAVMYLLSMFWGKNNLHNNGGEWLLWANGDGQGMWTQAGGLEVTWSSIIRSEEERKMVSKGWYQIIVWYVGTLCRDRIDNVS